MRCLWRLHPSAASLALVAFVVLCTIALGRDSASASSFSPVFTLAASNAAPNTAADYASSFDLNAPDANFAAVVSFIPPGYSVPKDADLPNGAIVGDLTSVATLGILDGPCNTSILTSFTFMDASTDINNTIDVLPSTIPDNLKNLAADADGNGLPDGVDKYPSFLNTLFKNAQPRARSIGFFHIISANTHVVLQSVVFEPGATLPDVGPLDPSLGYPSVTVLQNPTAAPAPSGITDFCSPLKSSTVTFGVSRDNPCTPTPGPAGCPSQPIKGPQAESQFDDYRQRVAALSDTGDEGGKTVRTNPGDGTYTFTLSARSQRDADGDGIENALDTCPYDKNVDDPRKSIGVDQDSIDPSCDPDLTSACAPGTADDFFATDCDQDGFLNAGDDCPLVANPDQKDTDLDGIGDACDHDPNTPDGDFHDVSLTQQVIIGTGVSAQQQTGGGQQTTAAGGQQQTGAGGQQTTPAGGQQQTGGGVGAGPGSGVGSLAPDAASIPAWAAALVALGGAGLLGVTGTAVRRAIKRRR